MDSWFEAAKTKSLDVSSVKLESSDISPQGTVRKMKITKNGASFFTFPTIHIFRTAAFKAGRARLDFRLLDTPLFFLCQCRHIAERVSALGAFSA